MTEAPFHSDLAEGPQGGAAYWVTARDGVRVRMAVWPKGEKGTVLLFPGRTEYIEKYGRAATELAQRGYATVAIDWRGQGLSDRPEPDRLVGHVEEFSHYQDDLAAVLAKLKELGQPGPFYLIAHSMGGCIGLRALMNGLKVQAAAFSAPMWGIRFAPGLEHVAKVLAKSARMVWQGMRYAPGTGPLTYVLSAPYEGNVLTRDRETYHWMQKQLMLHPELALGGPGLHWLDEAMMECKALTELASPNLPVLCFLGSSERVVDSDAVHNRMKRWPSGKLIVVDQAEHEVMMEVPATRKAFFDQATALFEAHR